jgi:hypothetical protein
MRGSEPIERLWQLGVDLRIKLAYWCWIVLSLASLSFVAGGCATNSRLTLAGTGGDKAFSHTFRQSYLNRNEEGDYQLVLIDDGMDVTMQSGQSGRKSIDPVVVPPVRQVVSIRMYWRPVNGSKSNFPSASNAAVDWYVMGTGGQRETDLIHYQGTGFVQVSRSGDSANVRLANGLLKPVVVRGQMTDPIGPATVIGTIHARFNRQQVQSILAELKESRTGMEFHATAE